jgi:hypothetical protein
MTLALRQENCGSIPRAGIDMETCIFSSDGSKIEYDTETSLSYEEYVLETIRGVKIFNLWRLHFVNINKVIPTSKEMVNACFRIDTEVDQVAA